MRIPLVVVTLLALAACRVPEEKFYVSVDNPFMMATVEYAGSSYTQG